MISRTEPLRPLGQAGGALWTLGLTAEWLTDLDVELLQLVAEQQDERVALRLSVFQAKPRDAAIARRSLRDLDRGIAQNLVMLGLAGQTGVSAGGVAGSLPSGRRATLQAIAARLADAMDVTSDAVAAQIAGQLRAVLTEIDDAMDEESVSLVDDLARKRDRRIADAKAAASS